MQNRTDLSVSKKILLQIICIIVGTVMAISMLGACSKTGENVSSAPSSETSSSESEPTTTDEQEPSVESTTQSDGDTTDLTDEIEDITDYKEEPVTLKVYNSKAPINTNYMGMNATVWHTFGFMKDDRSGRVYTDEMMDIELDRLQGMGFKTCRTAFYTGWVWDNNSFNYSTPRMGYFIDYCKALQERGINVMFNHAWYMTMVGAGSKTGSEGYLNGYGDDLYGELAAYSDCIATEFKLTGDENPFDAGMGYETEHYKTEFNEDTVTEYFDRLAVSAIRYGLFTSNVIKEAKAHGVNNIDYLIYFTEPSSYSYTPTDPKGPHEQEYIFFCRTMRNVIDKIGAINEIKHVGPNQGHIITGDGLLRYVLEKDPDLFDVVTSHFYPTSVDVTADVYYDYCYEAINAYQQPMKEKDLWGKKEFWQDEFFAAIENYSHTKTNLYTGTQTVVGAICSQQMGVDNVLMWQAFDQLWTDNAENAAEFSNGIHITGTCPSLFVSQTPHNTYYTTGLFTRYNNSVKNGKAYPTSTGDYNDYPGLYIGATQLEDGNWTFTVVSVNAVKTDFVIQFDKPFGKNLHRHVEDTVNRVPKTSAIIAEADCTFKNVQTTLSDTIAPYAVHVYTTCEY